MKSINKRLVGLFLFLPFLVVFATSTSMMRGLVITKSFYLEACALLYLIVLAFRIFDKNKKPTIKYLDLALFAYWSYTLVGEILIGRLPFYENFKLLELTAIMVIYIVWRMKVKDHYLTIVSSILLLCSFQCLLGYGQLLGLVESNHQILTLTGSFLSPSIYGAFLASVFPFALGAALLSQRNDHTSSRLLKYGSYFTILNILILLPVTQARAAWISIIISSAIIAWGFYKEPIQRIANKVNKTLITSSVIAAVLLSGVLLYQYKPDSAQGRLLIWKVTKDVIIDKPILGHGYSSFSNTYNNHQAVYFSSNNNVDEILLAAKVNYCYNEFLSVWAEQGIIGFLLFGSVFFFLFRLKAKTPEAIWGKAGVSGIFVLALVSYPFSMPIVWLLFFLHATILISFAEEKQKITINKTALKLAYALFFFGSLSLVSKENTRIKAYKTWARAYSDPVTDRQLQKYKTIHPYLRSDGLFLLHFGQLLTHNREYTESNKVLVRASEIYADPVIYSTMGQNHYALGDVKKADECYNKAINMIPNLFDPRYRLALMYDKLGAWSKAHQIANDALQIPVKVNSDKVNTLRQRLNTIKQKNKRK